MIIPNASYYCTIVLENFRDLRKFSGYHDYASDFIERIRSHREEREVEGQEDDFFRGALQTCAPKSYLRELRVLRG